MQKANKWCLNKPKPEYKVDTEELRKRLTPVQFRVTQDKATERPFSGEYLKLKDNGMYACVVCGEELFSSETKYDSGCGWPAFFDTIDSKKVRLAPDLSHVGANLLLLAIKPDLVRTEVTCAKCGSHLGHVFDDGPRPTGKRYCINSAALKFKKQQSNNVENECLNSKETVLCRKKLHFNEESEEKTVESDSKCGIKPSIVPRESKALPLITPSGSNLSAIKSCLKPVKSTTTPRIHPLLETHL